jgi:hypothetical protein
MDRIHKIFMIKFHPVNPEYLVLQLPRKRTREREGIPLPVLATATLTIEEKRRKGRKEEILSAYRCSLRDNAYYSPTCLTSC